MNATARRCFASAVVFTLLGMALGLFMAITHDHGQMPTHAHIMVLGWVSFAIFGFFYHLFPQAAESRAAGLHFWLALISALTLFTGLFIMLGGHEEFEPMAAIGAIGYFISTLVFAAVAYPVLRPATARR